MAEWLGEVDSARRAPFRQAGLEKLLCGLPHPVALHFQDWLGQSTTFKFPFEYNYSQQFSCEGDTLPTYQMLQRVRSKCPTGLREVKVNAELFAFSLSPDGQKGEDNGALVVNAGPHEVASRLKCYAEHQACRRALLLTAQVGEAGLLRVCLASAIDRRGTPSTDRCPSAALGRSTTGSL